MYFGNGKSFNLPLDWFDKISIVAIGGLIGLGVKELIDIIVWCFKHISVSIV
jgi:hypothetical protein